ncbi:MULTISPECIES: hypothetical protein [Anaerococcus]|uniref:hypothetical protein n=1 Tax=Anaerococcus TaxID=165779 RepID=UPI0002F9E300|nr:MULTISPECIES: hypothetical protein [Anaerococcus]MDU1317155.1 integrase [Anaerococcus hydrogenalis]
MNKLYYKYFLYGICDIIICFALYKMINIYAGLLGLFLSNMSKAFYEKSFYKSIDKFKTLAQNSNLSFKELLDICKMDEYDLKILLRNENKGFKAEKINKAIKNLENYLNK